LDLAQSIDPALVVIDAGILALLVDACKSSWAVRVNGALWLALDKWIAHEARRARALAYRARWPGDRILPARVWIARIRDIRLDWRRRSALDQSVALVARQAGADWRVVADIALGVTTAHPRTRVVTLVVAARLV
jgi:hypothetical protein